MKALKVLKFALVLATMFAFSACEEEVITKSTDGDSQPEIPESED